jgi:hypothetical protein
MPPTYFHPSDEMENIRNYHKDIQNNLVLTEMYRLFPSDPAPEKLSLKQAMAGFPFMYML